MSSLPPRSQERRSWPRTQQNLRVFVHDPEDALDEPYPAWIVDQSPGGVCLSFERSVADMGNVLLLHAASYAAAPGVEVRVKYLRKRGSRVELGCEFTQSGGGEILVPKRRVG